MYFNLESNMLAYLYNNQNYIDGDTKYLVVSPDVEEELGDRSYQVEQFDKEFERHIESCKSAEITITFKPVYRAKYTDKEISKILRLFMQPYKKASYMFVPEYGDNYNLHYHGVIVCSSTLKSQIKKEANILLGRTQVKNIQYTQSYLKYCMKERKHIDSYDDLVVFNIKNALFNKKILSKDIV